MNIEKFDNLSPNESIGAFDGSGQWVELCTVVELRKICPIWREETSSEHIARDIRESRFPDQSARQLVVCDSVIDAVYLDLCLGVLDRDRVRLSLKKALRESLQGDVL